MDTKTHSRGGHCWCLPWLEASLRAHTAIQDFSFLLTVSYWLEGKLHRVVQAHGDWLRFKV